MNERIKCTLCGSGTVLFHRFRKKQYHRCTGCRSILMNPRFYLSREDEKKRYEEHNNDVEDPGYQRFVAPIVAKVTEKFKPENPGLDYGAGPGPVITKLLRDKGYRVELYDPFFWDNAPALDRTYDYIACCEVIEHFHSPRQEFALLRSLLKTGGSLYCMTEIYSDDLNFEEWYYKNDPTHVFFYHRRALEIIQSRFDFKGLTIDGRLIHLEVGE